jgi:hypothetical protein
MMKKKIVDSTAWGIIVGKQAVVGFRYATDRVPGKGDNVIRDGEVRVAPLVMAVLGQPSSIQHAWNNQASAKYVAGTIRGAKVIELASRGSK